MHASTQDAAAYQASAADLAEQLLALWRRVMATNALGAYAIFEELDLTLTQVKALCALSGDELTVKELAERLGLSLPGTSRAVDALVERDLVDRREHARDRRMKRLRTTPAGHATLGRLDEARLAGLEAFTATLPHAQRKRLAAALRPIVDGLEEAT
jgi:DNA-binding MarR family transcriptional regulator